MGATNLEVSPSVKQPRKEHEGSTGNVGPHEACWEGCAQIGFCSFAEVVWKAQVGCSHLLFSFLKYMDVVGMLKGLFNLCTRFLFETQLVLNFFLKPPFLTIKKDLERYSTGFQNQSKLVSKLYFYHPLCDFGQISYSS